MQATCQIQLCSLQMNKLKKKKKKRNVGGGIWKYIYLNFYYTLDVKKN